MTQTPAPRKASILYVDDDRENLDGFKAVFRREYDIHLANSAQEALDILKQKKIQVLITDQRMPEMTGTDLLEAIAKRHPDMLRFMLTGFSDFDPLVRALNEGRLQGYLSKPLDVSTVRDRIEDGLAKYYLKMKNKALNSSLQESEQQIKLQLSELEQVYAAAPVGLILVDRDYRIVRINEKLAEIDGCPVSDHIGRPLDEVVPDLADELKHIYRPVLEKGTPVTNIAIRGETPKAPGVVRNWLCSYFPFRGNNGDILGVIGGVIEVTELKHAEDNARRALAFTHNLLQTANAMIVGLDRDGRIQIVNPRVEKIAGYVSDELIGKNWFDDVAPKDIYPRGYEEFMRLIEGGLPREFESPILARDGNELIISWSNSELIEDGVVTGALLVGIDITRRRAVEKEKKRLTQQLRHAQKMEAIGTLAGGIAHDFNNVLSPIIGYAEIIMSDTDVGSEDHDNADEILKAGMRARDLVNQILTFSREREQEKKPIKIQPVIKEALKLLRASLPMSIELSQRIDSNCGPILGDPTQIYQVVMNLCTNAYQAMQEQGGLIEVDATEIDLTDDDRLKFVDLVAGPYVRVTVSDTGSGIDPEIMESIFDPYFSTKRMKSGTGLGLSVVHGIVKGHAGDIKVSSEPGHGASFSIYLPRLVDRKSEATATEKETIIGGNESLLLVDDEEALVGVTQRLLEGLGYQVTGVTDPREALAVLKKDPESFNLMISDMTMPYMSGLELAEAVLLERSDMPIIICTGFSELISQIKVTETGIRGVIMKPILRSDIAKKIREVLDG